ncbi:MAG: hypothetical protein ACLTMH_17410 [Faecalimonas umbilicata]|uniref:hypothetical protein n=1 Tax=Faecalimonas umbilicata TaxID=1912855 RepID=UPI0039925F78
MFVNDGETVFSTRYYPQDYEIKIEAWIPRLHSGSKKMFPSGFLMGTFLLCKKDCQMYKSVCIFLCLWAVQC